MSRCSILSISDQLICFFKNLASTTLELEYNSDSTQVKPEPDKSLWVGLGLGVTG